MADPADGGPRTVQVLQVTGPGRVEWVPRSDGSLRAGCARLDTLASGVSTGTELTFVTGSNPVLARRFDPGLGLFVAAEPDVDPYPVTKLGYMQVGRVVASRTDRLPVGAVVAATYGHATGHDLDPAAERSVPLPAGMDPLLGVYVAHMGPICANGLLHAAAEEVAAGGPVEDLGGGVRDRRVLVTGAGVVGLLSAVLARHHGAAEVLVADPTPARREVARRLGLEAVDPGEDLGALVKRRWSHGAGDCGADLALQCRGQAWALQAALRSLRPQRTVVDLAFYPAGAEEVRLGEEFHHNGLRLVCAQIGRVPRAAAEGWDRDRLSAATLDLLVAHGPALREHLLADLVPAREAPALLTALAARERQTLQAVLVAFTELSGADLSSTSA